ncbi:MAG: FAD-dependent oxidoreductase, partial [Actinobacteria bacterium]|nr:FAD-dependent oxidoreductase [Actinomycetota bacterium]NIU64321.1 FAD-dependent oxidoreductase [Actinomycetota bacterium]NIW26138.1 FAD-dependent oxidoreductase [Actinomycetota bacterium]NIX18707.1 FAD-dependent oxidoreductase [Actinomycetota bacterium]
LPQLMVRSTAGRTHPVEGPDLPNLSGTGIALRRRADGGYTVSTGDYVEHYVGPRSFR